MRVIMRAAARTDSRRRGDYAVQQQCSSDIALRHDAVVAAKSAQQRRLRHNKAQVRAICGANMMLRRNQRAKIWRQAMRYSS